MHIQYALSLTGMLARPLCGCLGTVNVAVVGELSPNTGRGSTDSGDAWLSSRSLLQLTVRVSRWAKLQEMGTARL